MNMSNFWNDKRTFSPADPAPGGAPTTEPAPPQADPSPAVNPAPPMQASPQADAGPDLSFIPADYHTDGKPDLAKFGAHYNEVVAEAARRQEALADVPEDGVYDFNAEVDYGELDLPEGFDVDLGGEAYQPLYAELGAILKEFGVPKSQAGKLGGLIKKYEAMKYSQAYSAHKAEMAQLGTPAQQQARMGAIVHKLESTLPAEQAAAIKAATQSAAGIRALETLLAPRNLATPSPQPRTVDLEGLTGSARLKAINQMAAQKRA